LNGSCVFIRFTVLPNSDASYVNGTGSKKGDGEESFMKIGIELHSEGYAWVLVEDRMKRMKQPEKERL
jgi:hypothetical protein